MDERVLEIFTAITLLLIGLHFVIADILEFLGAPRTAISDIFNFLSWLLFIFAIMTAVLLIKDVTSRKEED